MRCLRIAGALCLLWSSLAQAELAWTPAERHVIAAMAPARMPPLPPSPGNRMADLPQARALGEALFNDRRLSRNGRVACATCHRPDQQFSDGRRFGRGLAEVDRHVPTLLASAWSPWQFWDGRSDSLWAQAVQPLRDPREQGLDAASLLRELRRYRQPYAELFGALPERIDSERTGVTLFVNVGKAIEAYERTLRPPRTPFDDYAEAVAAGRPGIRLSAGEEAGLRVFIGKGQCARCHLGPLLTNHGFANTGLAGRRRGRDDIGRERGLGEALADPLRCGGAWHDTRPAACPQLAHARLHAPEWLGAFKVPTLRQVARTGPYMHDGRFATLEEVVAHYQRAQNPDGDFGHTELRPLALTPRERSDLVSFLKVL